MKKFLILVLAVALLAVGAWWLIKPAGAPRGGPGGATGAPGGAPALSVRVAQARVTTVRENIGAVGTLLADEAIMIRPEIDGRIAAIHFREGQPVAAGAPLVTLDASEIEAQLQAVAAELALNRSRLARAEELRRQNFISAQALDDARATLDQSLARDAELRARLSKTVIRAPFDGVAGLRHVSPGAFVSKGQDIARFEGIGTLKVDFRVPETVLARLKPGQPVTVSVDAYPGEPFQGAIYAIEPAVDEASRTLLLRARVPNPGVRLKPGMFARVTLVLGVRENAVVVPEAAIVPRGQAFFVYKVIDNTASLARVTLGQREPGWVEIVQGVTAGEQIVTDGTQRLRDGATVKIQGANAAPGNP